MKLEEATAFVRKHRLAVLASRSPEGAVQAALIGIAVTDRNELVFDTLSTSRKFQNLLVWPQVALVVGWDNEVTLQCEGFADVPTGSEAQRCIAAYMAQFADGAVRAADPDIRYLRIRLSWARLSDFGAAGTRINEWRAPQTG